MSATQWDRVLRRNASFVAMTDVLNGAGVPWSIESGTKHPKLVFEAGGRTHKHVMSISTATPRSHILAAQDVRRVLRAAGLLGDQQEQDMEAVQISTDLVVPEIGIIEREGEPLARDVDIAERLGFDRPRDIRKLIVRNMAEIEALGTCATAAHVVRGNPVTEYLLTEEQALLVSTLSSAPNAPAVRAMLIRTFVAWRRGHLQPASSGGDDIGVMLELMQEQFDRVLAAIAATPGLTEEQMRSLLRTHCEWEARQHRHIVDQTHVSGGRVIKALRGGSAPAISHDDEVDIDAAYKACGVQEHLPARRKLSVVVGNRLDAYCRDRRITLGTVISLGQRVRTWPRQAVLAWFSEGGREFIADHIRRHTVDGQGVIAFPGGAR